MHGYHGANKKYNGILGAARVIMKEEGWRGFYRGNSANVARIVPTYALKFTLNDQIRDQFRRPGEETKDMSFLRMMAAGTMAGMLQFSVTYPLEVIRTRLTLADVLSHGHKYRGIIHCGVDTVKREGWTALYKGFGPTLLSGSPYVGLQMTFYQVYQRSIPEDSPVPLSLRALVAGALAGLTAQTITFPGDTLRSRFHKLSVALG